jgi:hypothetical protein
MCSGNIYKQIKYILSILVLFMRKKTKSSGRKSRVKTSKISKKAYSKKAREWNKKNPQTGTVKDRTRDRARKAKLPGKRISKNGKVYYEYRKNRSDAMGRRI